MINTSLGRLKKLELRNVWLSEVGDFNPWLAKAENLALLSEAVGMDLELEAQERSIGSFRADLLCKDIGSNKWVLIENQLEKTNHVHLGQVLTYAAGLNAVTIIWIARKFTNEHRATLDWLNEITDDRFNFFGLEIELWSIGNSPPAPKFNIVSSPNDWTKSITEGAKQMQLGELSETKKLQLEYWSELRDFLIQTDSILRPQKPLPQSWTNFAIGRSNFTLSASINARSRQISVELVLSGQDAKTYFQLLKQQMENIEVELGEKPIWLELPKRKICSIRINRNKTDPLIKEDWLEQHLWFKENLERFHKAFFPHIKTLDINEFLCRELIDD